MTLTLNALKKLERMGAFPVRPVATPGAPADRTAESPIERASSDKPPAVEPLTNRPTTCDEQIPGHATGAIEPAAAHATPPSSHATTLEHRPVTAKSDDDPATHDRAAATASAGSPAPTDGEADRPSAASQWLAQRIAHGPHPEQRESASVRSSAESVAPDTNLGDLTLSATSTRHTTPTLVLDFEHRRLPVEPRATWSPVATTSLPDVSSSAPAPTTAAPHSSTPTPTTNNDPTARRTTSPIERDEITNPLTGLAATATTASAEMVRSAGPSWNDVLAATQGYRPEPMAPPAFDPEVLSAATMVLGTPSEPAPEDVPDPPLESAPSGSLAALATEAAPHATADSHLPAATDEVELETNRETPADAPYPMAATEPRVAADTSASPDPSLTRDTLVTAQDLPPEQNREQNDTRDEERLLRMLRATPYSPVIAAWDDLNTQGLTTPIVGFQRSEPILTPVVPSTEAAPPLTSGPSVTPPDLPKLAQTIATDEARPLGIDDREKRPDEAERLSTSPAAPIAETTSREDEPDLRWTKSSDEGSGTWGREMPFVEVPAIAVTPAPVPAATVAATPTEAVAAVEADAPLATFPATARELELLETLKNAETEKSIVTLRDEIRTRNRFYLPTTLVACSVTPSPRTADILIHLAMVQCQEQEEILLVDANLGDQSLTRAYEALDVPGFCDGLAGRKEPWEIIRPTSLPNVWLIPSGDDIDGYSRLPERTNVDRMQAMLDLWKQHFHRILIDAGTPDACQAQNFAQRVDASCLVVPNPIPSKERIAEAAERLKTRSATFLGPIVTDEPR